jgi:predicted O-linked N-acetylglucosamine transferase (SPINDLY family)
MAERNPAADLLATAFGRLRDGDAEGAARLLRERMATQPDDARALALLARTQAALGDTAGARSSAEHALRSDPDSVPALVELAALERLAGDQAGLRSALERMVQLAPQVAAFTYDLAMLDLSEKRHEPAQAGFERAAARKPAWIEPLHGLGTVLLERRQPTNAIAVFRRCLAIDPDHVPSLEGFATAQRRVGHSGNFEELLAARLRIAALRPASVEAQYRVANAYRNVELFADAAQWYDKVLALDPGDLTAIWARFQHPDAIINVDAAAERAFLERWRQGLARFERIDPDDQRTRGYFGPVLTNATSFYLHYLGEPFVDEQRRYARVVERMARALLPELVASAATEPAERLRVGFVSGFLRRHTITKLMGALIEGLDRSRFEVSAYHLDDHEDATTAAIRARVDRFESGERNPGDWAQLLHAAALDVVVYLDIGMHPTVQTLAAFRFAPLQCALWGHPVTTGFEHIDWFVSAELMEPPDAQRHYTERLALLPGIGTCFEPPALEPDPAFVPPARAEAGTVHYLFAQSAYKIHPAHDDVLARIAAEVPNARFSLVPFPRAHVRDALAARMRGAFERRGLDFERHVHILPLLSEERFLALARSSDLNLDSIGWSGGNTTLEITWFDVPTITLPGAVMRSRHTQAMLLAMDLPELVVRDEDEYVRLAVALGKDRVRREALRARVRERKHVLYRDRRVVEAFQRFLLDPASFAL